MLKGVRLKEGVDKLIIAAFEAAWKQEAAYSKSREQLIAEQAKKAKQRVVQLTDAILTTTSGELKRVYEEQLEQAAKDLRGLEALKPMTSSELAVPYQTALEKATQLLKEPYTAWHSVDVFEKQKLFYFIFDEKLLYSKKDGYQTAFKACTTRLFEEFVIQNDPVCGDGRS